MAHPLAGKTSLSLVTMLALLAIPYMSPRLSALRIGQARSEAKTEEPPLPGGGEASPALSAGETELRASRNEATVTNALPETPALLDPQVLAKTKGSIAVEDPTGRALDAFYTQLQKTRAKEAGAVTRILHYGDSVITSDYISGTMRRRMQAEFGDAGHGFLLLANPWEWYFHNDVVHGASEGWSSSRITGPLVKDGMYGVGGVTFTGKPPATAFFGTSDRGTHGKKVSRFDVYYLETPNGGEVEARLGGDTARFTTTGDGKASRVKSLSVPDGEAKLTLRVVSGAPRMFGVALERDVPGVVYDALGANGARGGQWSGIDAGHWAEQMALRKPALIVLQYGTNESEFPGLTAEVYESSLRAVVEKLKAAAPSASILIVAPLDRAENDGKGGLRTRPIIKRLVAWQRNVALSTGVAFWNTYDAMGGEGTMGKWVQKGLAGGDLTHPTPQGGEVLGDLLYKAVSTGFEAWSSRRGGVPSR